LIGENNFVEIYCKCSLEICEKRDIKGLYQRARNGEIKHFTGISSPYEAPDNANLIIDTGSQTLENCVDTVIQYLVEKGMIKAV
jgi:adenylylsulfate kinase